MTIDLSTLTDGDLDDLRVQVANEQERRTRLASAPAQAAELARRFVADGGDLAAIVTAVTETGAE